jgi:diguanylate cyclase (GGDEF)-like protein/PAS domain S-box-containing protein
MVGAMIKVKEEQKVIIFTLIAVALIWTVDAAYDAFIAREGAFFQLLANVTHHEPFLRIFMTLGFLFFGVIISRILSKHNRVEELLRKQSAAIESSMEGIAIYNKAGEYVFVNQAYAEINGYAGPEEVMGKTYRQAYDERELERIDQVCLPVLMKNGRWRGELIAKRKNGSTYFQEASVTMLEDGGRVCIISDITWRKRSEERLRRSERFLNMIFNSIRDPFCIFDNEFRVIRANEAYAALKNMRVDDLIGRKCHEVLANRDTVCDACVVDKSFQSADPCAKEKQVTLRDGTAAWLEIYTYPILDEDGKAGHVMEYTRDITERKKAEDEKHRLIERLEYLSSTDSITGLMNRRALTDSLIYEIDRAKRYRSALSIILCDIDSFKETNDTWGHDMGDRVLQTISATLKTILRSSDIVGRHGGDEFLLILPETSDKGAEGLADKLLAAVRNTDLRSHDGRLIGITLSIGVACLDIDFDDLDSLLKRADGAMYASKQGGKNRVSTARS